MKSAPMKPTTLSVLILVDGIISVPGGDCKIYCELKLFDSLIDSLVLYLTKNPKLVGGS